MDVTQASVADACHRPGRWPLNGIRPAIRTTPGDSRASVALDVYMHLLAGADKEMARRLEQALDSGPQGVLESAYVSCGSRSSPMLRASSACCSSTGRYHVKGSGWYTIVPCLRKCQYS